MLLDRGADVDAVNKNGMTALHMVASSYAHEADLLRYYGRVGAASEYSRTRFHGAALERSKDVAQLLRSKDVAQLLLDNGANVNATDKDGRTSLYIVVSVFMDDHMSSLSHEIMSEQWEATLLELPKLLLSRGAHPSLANKDGKMPMHIAAKYRMQKKLTELLKQNWQADPEKVPPAVELEDDSKREQELSKLLESVGLASESP
ncbi:TPA: hypothetical protein ACH3X1_016478 [Trebouxia sp. C0004]